MIYVYISIAVSLWVIVALLVRRPRSTAATVLADQQNVEILAGSPGKWRHHSWRPKGHPDIAEAEHRTPGMAVIEDGILKEGLQ